MERFGRRCPVVESTGAVRCNVRNTYRAICGWFTTLPVTTFSKPQLSTLLIILICNNYETYDSGWSTDQKNSRPKILASNLIGRLLQRSWVVIERLTRQKCYEQSWDEWGIHSNGHLWVSCAKHSDCACLSEGGAVSLVITFVPATRVKKRVETFRKLELNYFPEPLRILLVPKTLWDCVWNIGLSSTFENTILENSI